MMARAASVTLAAKGLFEAADAISPVFNVANGGLVSVADRFSQGFAAHAFGCTSLSYAFAGSFHSSGLNGRLRITGC